MRRARRRRRRGGRRPRLAVQPRALAVTRALEDAADRVPPEAQARAFSPEPRRAQRPRIFDSAPHRRCRARLGPIAPWRAAPEAGEAGDRSAQPLAAQARVQETPRPSRCSISAKGGERAEWTQRCGSSLDAQIAGEQRATRRRGAPGSPSRARSRSPRRPASCGAVEEAVRASRRLRRAARRAVRERRRRPRRRAARPPRAPPPHCGSAGAVGRARDRGGPSAHRAERDELVQGEWSPPPSRAATAATCSWRSRHMRRRAGREARASGRHRGGGSTRRRRPAAGAAAPAEAATAAPSYPSPALLRSTACWRPRRRTCEPRAKRFARRRGAPSRALEAETRRRRASAPTAGARGDVRAWTRPWRRRRRRGRHAREGRRELARGARRSSVDAASRQRAARRATTRRRCAVEGDGSLGDDAHGAAPRRRRAEAGGGAAAAPPPSRAEASRRRARSSDSSTHGSARSAARACSGGGRLGLGARARRRRASRGEGGSWRCARPARARAGERTPPPRTVRHPPSPAAARELGAGLAVRSSPRIRRARPRAHGRRPGRRGPRLRLPAAARAVARPREVDGACSRRSPSRGRSALLEVLEAPVRGRRASSRA